MALIKTKTVRFSFQSTIWSLRPLSYDELSLRTFLNNNNEEIIMWTKPAYQDLRIGFEVTMYFANR